MNETITTFLQLSIVGVALSYIIEIIKAQYGPKSFITKGLTILLAIILGVFVYFSIGTPVWQATVGILAAASTFYAFIIRK